eukprot:7350943-Pyramimonas_sp.AAC.1
MNPSGPLARARRNRLNAHARAPSQYFSATEQGEMRASVALRARAPESIDRPRLRWDCKIERPEA